MKISISKLALLLLLAPGLAFASQSGGAGASQGCVGGEPYYCLRTDRAIMMPALIPPGVVNVPFVLPESGVTMVRATNYLTDPSNLGISYTAQSGDYFSTIGNEDPQLCGGTGGHRYLVLEHSIGLRLYTFCDKTMQSSFDAALSTFNAPQIAGVGSMAHVDPAEVFGVAGTKFEYYCSPDATSASTVCAGKGGTYTVLYDMASCPNLPWAVDPTFPTPPTTNGNDTIISTSMSDQQNFGGITFTYNILTGNCYWFNPATYTYGGTGITPTASSLGTPYSDILSNAPTVTTTAGGNGTYPAATYDVCVTYTGDWMAQAGVGETPCSAIKKITLAAVGNLQITPSTATSSVWNSLNASSQPIIQNFSAYACEPDPCTPTLQDYYFIQNGDGTTKSFTATISSTAYPSLAPASDKLAGSGAWDFTNGDPWGYWGSSGWEGYLYYSYSALSGVPAPPSYPVSFATAPPAGHPVWIRWDGATNPQNATSQTTMTLNTYVTNGPTAPSGNAAGGGFGIHTSSINQGGSRDFWESHGTMIGWNAQFINFLNGTVVNCDLFQGCEGHLAFGGTTGLGIANSLNYSVYPFTARLNFTSWGLDTPNSYSYLAQAPPQGAAAMNLGTSHVSWNNDITGADKVPFMVGSSSTNGPLPPLGAADMENILLSPVNGTIYRLGPTRATGEVYVGGGAGAGDFWYYAFGSISPDGKLAMTSGDWFGETGCAYCNAWQASHSFAQGSLVYDQNGNTEINTSACTTGSTEPVFPSGPFGVKTTDGTCTFVLTLMYGLPNYSLTWNASAFYYGGGYTLDSNFDWEYESVQFCESGATLPVWPAIGQSVTDGTCKWSNAGASSFTAQPSFPNDRTDVWLVELK